jgi:hypothetical protein
MTYFRSDHLRFRPRSFFSSGGFVEGTDEEVTQNPTQVWLLHRTDREPSHEPVDEEIIDNRNRHARDQAGAHHRATEIDVAAHQEGRHADAHGVARRRSDEGGSLSELINERGRSLIQIIERMPLTIIINPSHQYFSVFSSRHVTGGLCEREVGYSVGVAGLWPRVLNEARPVKSPVYL